MTISSLRPETGQERIVEEEALPASDRILPLGAARIRQVPPEAPEDRIHDDVPYVRLGPNAALLKAQASLLDRLREAGVTQGLLSPQVAGDKRVVRLADVDDGSPLEEGVRPLFPLGGGRIGSDAGQQVGEGLVRGRGTAAVGGSRAGRPVFGEGLLDARRGVAETHSVKKQYRG